MRFTEQLKWRRAVKAFEVGSQIPSQDYEKILSAIQMAPTSYGLQPFYVVEIKDIAIKQKLQKAGFGQKQFETAEYVLVFVAMTNILKRIDEYLELARQVSPEEEENIQKYDKVMRSTIGAKDAETVKHWAQRQIYIALGFAMAACAELNIDCCPMEGFIADEFDKILKLPKGDYSSVALTIGAKRDPNVALLTQKKFPLEKIIKRT